MPLNAVLSGAHERSYNSVLFLPARKEGWRFSCPSPSSIPRSTITMRQVTKVAPRPRPSSSFSLVFLARRRLRLLPASSAKRSEERRRKQIKVRKQTFASSFPPYANLANLLLRLLLEGCLAFVACKVGCKAKKRRKGKVYTEQALLLIAWQDRYLTSFFSFLPSLYELALSLRRRVEEEER